MYSTLLHHLHLLSVFFLLLEAFHMIYSFISKYLLSLFLNLLFILLTFLFYLIMKLQFLLTHYLFCYLYWFFILFGFCPIFYSFYVNIFLNFSLFLKNSLFQLHFLRSHPFSNLNRSAIIKICLPIYFLSFLF